jgi:hypothetical protein
MNTGEQKWENFKQLQKKVNVVGISGLSEIEEHKYSLFLKELEINDSKSKKDEINIWWN